MCAGAGARRRADGDDRQAGRQTTDTQTTDTQTTDRHTQDRQADGRHALRCLHSWKHVQVRTGMCTETRDKQTDKYAQAKHCPSPFALPPPLLLPSFSPPEAAAQAHPAEAFPKTPATAPPSPADSASGAPAASALHTRAQPSAPPRPFSPPCRASSSPCPALPPRPRPHPPLPPARPHQVPPRPRSRPPFARHQARGTKNYGTRRQWRCGPAAPATDGEGCVAPLPTGLSAPPSTAA